jgi:hypothetical protein
MATNDHAANDRSFQRQLVATDWRSRQGASIAFAVACLGTLVVALLQSKKLFYFDSGNYWMLGETFVRHGNFSLLNFASPLRGYLLPLIDHALQGLADGFDWSASMSVKIFNVFVFASIGALLAPRVAMIAWPQQRWGPVRRILLATLLVVFWSGFLNFPLSDFPALAAMLLALVAVAHPNSLWWMLLAGLATGAAIDARPAYVLLAPLVLILLGWSWFERRDSEPLLSVRHAICLVLALIGFAAVSLPQSLISHRYFRTWSFVPGTAAHLESLQLTEGMNLQLVEGYVGPGHLPLMRYEDPAGQQVLADEQGHVITGLGQYAGVVARDPLAIAGLFSRHLINGLDERYSTPYIEHLDTRSHRWMRLAGFMLAFLALLRVTWPAARRTLGSSRWRYPVAVLLACATSVPSAVETRFLLPAYLLIYVLVLAPGWPSPLVQGAVGWRRYRTLALIALACVPFMLAFWGVTSATSSHLRFT